MPLKLTLTLLMFLSFSAQANWSPKSRALLADYKHPFSDSYLTTVWGNVVAIKMVLPETGRKIKKSTGKVPHYFFQNNYQSYFMMEYKNDDARRPLAIFNPGIFGVMERNQSVEWGRRLVRMGYRVVAFNNPLSVPFIELNPRFETADLGMQAKVNLECIRRLHAQLKQQGKVTDDVHVLGVSYGGFLSTAIYALDAASEKPIIKSVSAFSPPMDLVDSTNHLDEMIDETRDSEIVTAGLVKLYRISKRLTNLREGEQTALDMDHAKGLLGQYVFKKSLLASVKALEKTKDLNLIPDKRSVLREWKKKLNFSMSYETMSPNGYRRLKESDERSLKYWVYKAIRHGKSNIRILAAKDDVINAGIDPALLNTPWLLALPYGGHYGYNSLEWFDRLILTMF